MISAGVNAMRIVAAARAPRAARAGQRHRLEGSRPSGNTSATTGRIRAYPSGTSAGPSSTTTFATGSCGFRMATRPANAYPNGTAAKMALPTSRIAPIRPLLGRSASSNPTVA